MPYPDSKHKRLIVPGFVLTPQNLVSRAMQKAIKHRQSNGISERQNVGAVSVFDPKAGKFLFELATKSEIYSTHSERSLIVRMIHEGITEGWIPKGIQPIPNEDSHNSDFSLYKEALKKFHIALYSDREPCTVATKANKEPCDDLLKAVFSDNHYVAFLVPTIPSIPTSQKNYILYPDTAVFSARQVRLLTRISRLYLDLEKQTPETKKAALIIVDEIRGNITDEHFEVLMQQLNSDQKIDRFFLDELTISCQRAFKHEEKATIESMISLLREKTDSIEKEEKELDVQFKNTKTRQDDAFYASLDVEKIVADSIRERSLSTPNPVKRELVDVKPSLSSLPADPPPMSPTISDEKLAKRPRTVSDPVVPQPSGSPFNQSGVGATLTPLFDSRRLPAFFPNQSPPLLPSTDPSTNSDKRKNSPSNK